MSPMPSDRAPSAAAFVLVQRMPAITSARDVGHRCAAPWRKSSATTTMPVAASARSKYASAVRSK
jgi:hypothetical protein